MWLITGIIDTLVAKTSCVSSHIRSCLKLHKSTKGGNPCKFKKRHLKLQGAHPSGKSQGNLIFLQGQGKVREFCKMVREIRKS